MVCSYSIPCSQSASQPVGHRGARETSLFSGRTATTRICPNVPSRNEALQDTAREGGACTPQDSCATAAQRMAAAMQNLTVCGAVLLLSSAVQCAAQWCSTSDDQRRRLSTPTLNF
eukprot:2635023-Pyramimonas_sp.AAC.1